MTVELKIEITENQRKAIEWYYNFDGRRVRYTMDPAIPERCKEFLEVAMQKALEELR